FIDPAGHYFLDDINVCITPSCAAVAGGCPSGADCQGLNNGFETGDLQGWTQAGDESATAVFTGTFQGVAPHGGPPAAVLGAQTAGSVTQEVVIDRGDQVTADFWYAALGSNNSFAVAFDGVPLLSLTNDTAHTAWTHYRLPVTVQDSGYRPLTFTFTN